MGRPGLRVLVVLFLLVGVLLPATPTYAAFQVVVTVAPAEVVAGEPVEVLVRTFVPIARSREFLDVPDPREPYPVPSGLWGLLYPMGDYPLDIVARHPDGAEVAVSLARDPADATLWRGRVELTTPGTWTIRVRNYPPDLPGTSAEVRVAARGPLSTEGVLAGAAGLLLGLVGGLLLGRRWSARRQPAD